MEEVFEKELQRNAVLRSIYENSKVTAILIADTDGFILHLNEAFQHTYGYTPDDLRGKHGRVLFTEEDQKRLLPEIEIETVKQQGVFRDRNYIVHRDGSCLFTDGEALLVKNETGAPFICKLLQNIHDQKVAEKILRNAQQFSESVITSINEGLLVIALDGKILKVNKYFFEILDREETNVEGLYLRELDEPLFTAARFVEAVQTVIAEQQSKKVELEYRSKNGATEFIWVKMRFLEEGQPTEKILIVLSNVTEQVQARKKVEESETELQRRVAERTQELENMNKELQRSNANLEEFAHAASHDLKEPIRKIHFFTDQLKGQLSDRLSEVEKQTFKRIENATERMGMLVDDLLLYSHVSLRPHQKETVDLNEKLKKVLEDLDLDIVQKKAVITAGNLPTVKGYKRQLQQLFQNLISNALKYSKPGVAPVITITSSTATGKEAGLTSENEATNPFYLIEVRDNGIGFEQIEAERIFQMFQRLHGNAEYRGTGVGLSIARKVVENHGGKIIAEGEPGNGATFKVYLPAS